MAENDSASQAELIVRKYALGSLLPGILPIPWLDIALVSAVQLKMVQSLARLYRIEFSEHIGKAGIASLVGGSGSVSLALLSAQLLRPVPIIGPLAGVATMTSFGAASTYAVGKVFIQHFESGGTFLTFDPEEVRRHYRKLYGEAPANIANGAKGVKP